MLLSPAEVRVFRILKRTAAIYLLLLRLDRPVGESQIAEILDMSRQTVRAHLRSLSAISLVARTQFHTGWTLTHGGRQMILSTSPSPQLGKNYPVPTTTIKDSNLSKDELTVVEDSNWLNYPVEGDYPQVYPQISPQEPEPDFDRESPVWQALLEAGITPNARTRRLANMDHVTPEYVKAHLVGLQAVDKGHLTGLLITILESGAQAPELNERGHLESCNCEDCRREKYIW